MSSVLKNITKVKKDTTIIHYKSTLDHIMVKTGDVSTFYQIENWDYNEDLEFTYYCEKDGKYYFLFEYKDGFAVYDRQTKTSKYYYIYKKMTL